MKSNLKNLKKRMLLPLLTFCTLLCAYVMGNINEPISALTRIERQLHTAITHRDLEKVEQSCEKLWDYSVHNKKDFEGHLKCILIADKAGSLFTAVKYGYAEIVNFLIDYYHTDSRFAIDVNSVDHKGYSLLYWAVVYDRRQVVEVLCRWGADPNTVSPDGNTVLHCAMENERYDIAETLISAGGYRF